MNRRRFLSSLGIGAAALMLRFRPEVAQEIKAVVVASGEWGEHRWVLMSAFRPSFRQHYEPIRIHRCQVEI